MTSLSKETEVVAPDLAKLVIEAHGGLERWNSFTTLSVHGINGGVLWGAKGKAGVLDDVTITVDLRNEKASHYPFGSPDRRSRFEPQRVGLENANGEVLEELLQPRSSFQGHTLETPWSDLQLAYFAGCAMWTYLNISHSTEQALYFDQRGLLKSTTTMLRLAAVHLPPTMSPILKRYLA